MPVLAAAGAAAAAGAGGSLFQYNRRKLSFKPFGSSKVKTTCTTERCDRRLNTRSWISASNKQSFGEKTSGTSLASLPWLGLFALCQLTRPPFTGEVKMDTYLIVNAVQLGAAPNSFEALSVQVSPSWHSARGA